MPSPTDAPRRIDGPRQGNPPEPGPRSGGPPATLAPPPRTPAPVAAASPVFTRGRLLLSSPIVGYALSLVFHLLLMAGAAAYVIQGMPRSSWSLNASISDRPDEIDIGDMLDSRFDGSPDLAAEMKSQTIEIVSNDSEPPLPKLDLDVSDQMIAPALDDQGGESMDSGEGATPRYAKPSNGRVVKKGSFAVWTVPEDPDPFTDYLIVIEVKLPESVRRYRRTDLTGQVRGTDGYYKRLPESRGPQFITVRNHTAQLSVFIPGAEAKVRDVIEIRSGILKETQTLHLVF